jgi:RNA polymerase sigma factor (sigma-70 family)
MVLGVCRRVLRNWHDAEDTFQATFLVLSRSAGSIRCRQDIASWLYGVAYRTAMKARNMNAKRRAKERQASEMARCEASEDGVHEELLSWLDHELSRLPEKYRVPVVLCELEGRSRKEVALLLGLPEGTLSSRLASARKLLSTRLSWRGATLSLGALAVGLSPTLRASTLKTVFSAGAVTAKVLALTEGMMKVMFLSKLKITACAAALMLLAGVGATGLTYRATAEQPALASRPQSDELEALRLEIEALRKSLQATRERVKSLEGEVTALKGQSGRAGIPGGAPGGEIGAPGALGVGGHPPAQGTNSALLGTDIPGTQPSGSPAGGAGGLKASKKQGGMGMHPPGMMGGPGGGMVQMGRGQGMGGRLGQFRSSKLLETTIDPVSDAAAALEKLRSNPGDKQAVESLERALKRLKEREKQDAPKAGTSE